MNRAKEDERPLDSFIVPLDCLKASIDSSQVPECKSGLENISTDDLRDLGLIRANVDALAKTFDYLAQVQPHQIRALLIEWYRFLQKSLGSLVYLHMVVSKLSLFGPRRYPSAFSVLVVFKPAL